MKSTHKHTESILFLINSCSFVWLFSFLHQMYLHMICSPQLFYIVCMYSFTIPAKLSVWVVKWDSIQCPLPHFTISKPRIYFKRWPLWGGKGTTMWLWLICIGLVLSLFVGRGGGKNIAMVNLFWSSFAPTHSISLNRLSWVFSLFSM